MQFSYCGGIARSIVPNSVPPSFIPRPSRALSHVERPGLHCVAGTGSSYASLNIVEVLGGASDSSVGCQMVFDRVPIDGHVFLQVGYWWQKDIPFRKRLRDCSG